MVANVNALVYAKSPDELLKYNEEHLKAMGVIRELRSRPCAANKNIRLGVETRIVAALDAPWAAWPTVAPSSTAPRPSTPRRGALYYADSAEMLARFHRRWARSTRLVAGAGSGPGPHQRRAARPPGARRLHSLDEPVAQAVGVGRPAREGRLRRGAAGGLDHRRRQRAHEQGADGRGWKIETRKLGPENALAKSGGK